MAIMPTILLCYTLEYARRHESFVENAPLLLLNVLFVLSAVAIIQEMQVSTLTVWLIVGYMLAGAVFVLIAASVLFMRMWRQLQIRTQRLLANFRQEETTLSQIFLPN